MSERRPNPFDASATASAPGGNASNPFEHAAPVGAPPVDSLNPFSSVPASVPEDAVLVPPAALAGPNPFDSFSDLGDCINVDSPSGGKPSVGNDPLPLA